MKNISSNHTRTGLLCLVLVAAGFPIAYGQVVARPFAERFRVPPPEARILKIVHHLPETAEGQENLLDSLSDQRFGGMATNVAFDQYLESEEKWAALVQGVNMANARGMALWLYDERGYPSCKAGGLTLRDHPEWQAEGLYIADTIAQSGEVALDVPPGELVLASAFPAREDSIDLDQEVDLTDAVNEGRLSWIAPEGEWRVMVITKGFLHTGTHADGNLSDELPYPNLLLPEPTRKFIELTHAAYARRLENDLGRWFIATFTDEPSLMSLFLKRQPWRVLPWAPNLPGEFRKRRGHELEPHIPALVADAGPTGSAARYEFWRTVGELVSENYFGQIQAWCREHNTRSGGHLLMEESLLSHVPLYGDLFQCLRRLDAPSMDCLTSIPSAVPWYVARLVSSAAELEGRAVTMSETSDHVQHYRPKGDERAVRVVTEDEIRGACNRLMLNGITTITSYYSFAGLEREQLVRLNECIGRCCTALKGGHQVADVALLYPVESVWPRFVPSHRWTEACPPEAQRIETVYRSTATSLFAARRDFTIVDARALLGAEVDAGVLRHGSLEWRAVVLPCADTLPLEAWEKLAAFWRSGGVVIAVSRLPANSESEFPSPRVKALAAEVFGGANEPGPKVNDLGGAGVYLAPGSQILLPDALDSLLERDVRVSEESAPVRVTHRRIDGHEAYFLINDSGAPWSGTVGFAAEGGGERWDPATGDMEPLENESEIPLQLDAYSGALFRFDRVLRPERKRAGEGPLPGLNLSELPAVEPIMVKGEFVDGDVAPKGEGAWVSSARLTQGDVDTFLFVCFNYDTPLDLIGAACLVSDTSAPHGQRTPTPLRIIARDVHGAECIADTEHYLSAPGPERCHVLLSQFERAGWDQTTSPAFDWSAVTAIRVGWGGYIGAQDETVAFTCTLPRVGRVGER
jgi:hypothetical protein